MENQNQSNIARSIVQGIANFLLPSGERDLSTIFTKQTRRLIIILILLQFIIASPPFVEWIVIAASNFVVFASFKNDWGFWNAWLPYTQLVIEILFALFIGGSIFGNWLSNSSEEYVQKLETQLNLISNDNYQEVSSRLATNYKDLEATIRATKFGNFFSSLMQIIRLSRSISNILYADFPKKFTGIVAAKFMVSFPGGLYGLIAFALFWIIMSLETLSIYHGTLAPL